MFKKTMLAACALSLIFASTASADFEFGGCSTDLQSNVKTGKVRAKLMDGRIIFDRYMEGGTRVIIQQNSNINVAADKFTVGLNFSDGTHYEIPSANNCYINKMKGLSCESLLNFKVTRILVDTMSKDALKADGALTISVLPADASAPAYKETVTLHNADVAWRATKKCNQ